MRVVSLASAIALGLSAILTASSALAEDPPAPGSATAQAAPKKKVAKGKAKKKKPAPAPVKDEETTSEPTLVAAAPVATPAPQPQPVVVTQPTPEPAPTSQTSTTAATITSPADKDRIQKKDDEPIDGVSVAPLLGLATNGFGFGVGARVGYTLPMHLYVGAQFMYQFGVNPDPDVTSSAFYPSAEVGYDLTPARNLVVRPYGGAGMMFISASAGSYTAHEHSVAIYPGVAITYTIPKSAFFVGGDARLVLAPQFDGATSFGLFATGGMRF